MATSNSKAAECVFTDCSKKPLKEEKSCREHYDFFKRIREELEENPKLLYNQRSDNPNRTLTDKHTGKTKKSRGKKLPICCVPGCFEQRVPPDPYCTDHYGFAGGD